MLYQVMNFWPHRGVFAAIGAAETWHMPTIQAPTVGFTELYAQATLFSRPYDSKVTVYVVPEISNDGQNWERLISDRFGPLSTPATEIKSLPKIGSFLRYDIEANAGLAPGTLGMNLATTAIGRAMERPALRGATIEQMTAYLDAVQRGFDPGAAPGGGRLLLFWPNDTALTSDDGTSAWRTIYTPAQPVHEFTEIVARLRVESFIGIQGTSALSIYPEFTQDGSWWEDALNGFTAINTGTTLPFDETKKLNAHGAYMRFSLNFRDIGGLGACMGAKLEIVGVGR